MAQAQKIRSGIPGLDDLIECPIAHGEGRFMLAEPSALDTLWANDQIALRSSSS